MNEYNQKRAYFAAEDSNKLYNNESCIIGISTYNQEKHTGLNMAAIIELARQKQFKEIRILIGDSFQRYALAMESECNPGAMKEAAMLLSKGWLANNQHLFNAPNIQIYSYDEIIRCQEIKQQMKNTANFDEKYQQDKNFHEKFDFICKLTEIYEDVNNEFNKLYNGPDNDSATKELQIAINKASKIYADRFIARAKKENKQINEENAKHLSIQAMIEESIAVSAFAVATRSEYFAYPSEINFAIEAIRNLIVVPKYGKFYLNWLDIKIKDDKLNTYNPAKAKNQKTSFNTKPSDVLPSNNNSDHISQKRNSPPKSTALQAFGIFPDQNILSQAPKKLIKQPVYQNIPDVIKSPEMINSLRAEILLIRELRAEILANMKAALKSKNKEEYNHYCKMFNDLIESENRLSRQISNFSVEPDIIVDMENNFNAEGGGHPVVVYNYPIN